MAKTGSSPADSVLQPLPSFLDVARSFADKCGTIEGSDLRLTRSRGRRMQAGDGRNRLFEGEEAFLHIEGLVKAPCVTSPLAPKVPVNGLENR